MGKTLVQLALERLKASNFHDYTILQNRIAYLEHRDKELSDIESVSDNDAMEALENMHNVTYPNGLLDYKRVFSKDNKDAAKIRNYIKNHH